MPTLFTSLARTTVLAFALALVACAAFAQNIDDYNAAREQAIQLYKQYRMTEAMPILEKLFEQNPKDVTVVSLLAFTISANSQTIKDADARKRARIRARELAVKARELGDDSNLTKILLESIPADGSDAGFSERKDVDAVMREGEAAFVRGDFKKAIAAYELALQLNPQQYTAALFIGDVYFKQQQTDKAGEWFAKAIAINPDVETAYRYWGDALMSAGKAKEARDKFIEAIIAEPYSRRSWMGLAQWGERNRVQLAHPRIDVPKNSVQRKDDKNVNIFFSPSDKKDGSSAWFIYGISRASWMTEEKRKKEFPNEKEYRHSLREEAHALRMVADMAEGELKGGKVNEKSLDVSIANLIKLQRAGLIEAYVLFAMADQGIAQDYVEYRKNNREKLRQYLADVVAKGGQIK